MITSRRGIDLIKSFEGCKLTAYKAVATEKSYTIGYGHYGVPAGLKITQQCADCLLTQDLHKFEKSVESLCSALKLNQNEFDALVSFTYNCGAGNLSKLIKGRNKSQIADALLLYVKAGGKTLKGLQRRRQAERNLFLTPEGY